ncbi:hypothetical protein [Nonomuraea sp. NPDC003804]|uniref:hypothetical protein n=1 Tax=Nonomuraea sp. NPDC003804 TaxID=3154547 RepID=UPI0033A4A2BE
MNDNQNGTGHGGARCGGTNRGGQTCGHPAGWGTDHPGIGKCKHHGGSTPTHKAAAKAEMARRAVATYGLPREVDPASALLEEVHRSAGHVAWLEQKVRDLDEDELVWGVVEEVDKGYGEFTGTDTTSAAKPNVWLELYQKERKHLTDVSKAALAAGIAERQVRLAEQQGALIASVIGRILDDLELSDEQRQMVGTVVPRHLRAIA